MCSVDKTACEIFLGTRLVFGEHGKFARVSRCLPGSPRATLYETRGEADAVAALGKRCGADCVGNHSTEEIPALVDECPIELGYCERHISV
jgi:hypothetical protein